MQDSNIFIDFTSRMIGVDGVAYPLPPGDIDMPGVYSLRWTPGEKVPGFIEQKGDSHGFRDFSMFEPWLPIWEEANVIAVAEATEKAAAVAAAKVEYAAERAAVEANNLISRAHVAAWAPFNEAVTQLVATDHEIIKAMERILLGEPVDSPALKTLIAVRRQQRAVTKAAKVQAENDDPRQLLP